MITTKEFGGELWPRLQTFAQKGQGLKYQAPSNLSGIGNLAKTSLP